MPKQQRYILILDHHKPSLHIENHLCCHYRSHNPPSICTKYNSPWTAFSSSIYRVIPYMLWVRIISYRPPHMAQYIVQITTSTGGSSRLRRRRGRSDTYIFFILGYQQTSQTHIYHIFSRRSLLVSARSVRSTFVFSQFHDIQLTLKQFTRLCNV